MGMTESEIHDVLGCLKAKVKHFKKDSFIWHAGDPAKDFAIVINGAVNIIREDIKGNRIVIAHILKHQMFGEAFAIGSAKVYPVSTLAVEETNILLISGEALTLTCRNACNYHKQMIDNLLSIIANKNIKLNNRIEAVTKKTTREKVIHYLTREMDIHNRRYISIPLSRESLADYLGVNRSALSRELSNMKDEGIIDYHKNQFRLLNYDKLLDYI